MSGMEIQCAAGASWTCLSAPPGTRPSRRALEKTHSQKWALPLAQRPVASLPAGIRVCMEFKSLSVMCVRLTAPSESWCMIWALESGTTRTLLLLYEVFRILRSPDRSYPWSASQDRWELEWKLRRNSRAGRGRAGLAWAYSN